MSSLLTKVILGVLVVWLSSAFFSELYYPSTYQPILVGIVVAVVGRIMESITLVRGTAWLNTVLDVAAATLVIYFVSMFLSGAYVTWKGAFFTSLVIGLAEYVIHWQILRGGEPKRQR